MPTAIAAATSTTTVGAPAGLRAATRSRARLLTALACVASICCVAAPAAHAADDFTAARDALRHQREDVAKGAEKDRADRAGRIANAIGGLITLAANDRVPGQDEAIGQLLDGLALLDADQEKMLRVRLAALPPPPDTVTPVSKRTWETALENRRDSMLAPTRRMVQRAIDLGVPDLAGDLLRQYLTFYPDAPVVMRNLGLTNVHGHWYGPHEMDLVNAGLAWDDRLGWIVEKVKKRYEKGDYFDLDRQEWTTLDQADADHSQLDHPWTILTEHLEIHGNAHLVDLVDAANRLERFHSQVFTAYADFFSGEGKHADLPLIFGMSNHPRLVVNIERDKEDYARSLPATISAGWSSGLFVDGPLPASYFYAGPSEVLYHEFTHQILATYGERNHAPSWLVEGIAVYSQAPVFSRGNLTFGQYTHNQHIANYFSLLRDHHAVPLDALFAITTGAAWRAAANPAANYAIAGAFAQFAMEGANRRHRADFIDFLRDSYNEHSGDHTVWDYFGMSKAELLEEFTEWSANPDGQASRGVLFTDGKETN